MVDASAKPASGFFLGNNFWLGSRDQCNYVGKKIAVEISERFDRNMKSNLFSDISPFEVEMKFVFAEHDSPLQGN